MSPLKREINTELLKDTKMEQHKTKEDRITSTKQQKHETFFRTMPLEIITDNILLEEISQEKLRILSLNMQYEILNRASQSMQELQLQITMCFWSVHLWSKTRNE